MSTGLEQKVVDWIQKEFPESNCKVDVKDLARLIKSSNGHHYIKLFSTITKHYVSKDKANNIIKRCELIELKRKKEVLKNDIEKLSKDLNNLIVATKQEEKRLNYESMYCEKMQAKETFLQTLASTLDKVVENCEKFAKADPPEICIDQLKLEKMTMDNLIPEECFPISRRTRTKESDIRKLAESINEQVSLINSLVLEISNQQIDIPQVNLDEGSSKKLLEHECLSTVDDNETDDTSKKNDLFRNVDEFGSNVLKVLEEYEEQRSSQEPKVLSKLDNACSMLDRQTKETQNHKPSSHNS
ncbi:uncharacterized protein LOC141852688 [Brevipalpus obovatus]|uniref:uncharacterized protein LOC141852688 n=1 Tax=Brevipalpus obovatus TaxID=246614 RepID=UPI003D9DBDAD